MRMAILLVAALLLLPLAGVATANVTGNPYADGWTFGGNSLSNGVYVRETANYGFDTYSTLINILAGSNLEISDGDNSWIEGDTVLGIGGRFADITASEAGWSAFDGVGVNSILGEDTKFVAKFGTSGSTFAASTIAPDDGNGLGSLSSNGGLGAVQVRTSGWFYGYTHLPETETTWAGNSGQLMLLDKPTHISRNGAAAPDTDVARLMWIWNPTSGHVDSWEILLNVSLLDRLYPTFEGPTPGAGDKGIVAVQRRDGVYTDALVSIPQVPEPSSLLALMGGLGALLGFRRRRA